MQRLLTFLPPLLRPQMQAQKVLVVTGPTAVGKSSLALSLHPHIPLEIVSADSVQVYRNLNIASNKPTPQEQSIVRHHMLDIADPTGSEHTAGDYFRAARKVIADVLDRGKVPVVVGGTMMYVRWLVYGRPATPPAPEEVKQRVDAMLRGVDWEGGVELLRERDRKRAEVLSRNDWYRLRRALEVVETTGVAMTDMPLVGAAPGAECGDVDFDFRCVFLFDERVALNRRIDQRCEEMIWGEGGQSVLEEVGELLRGGGVRVAQAAPSRAIGYRQTIAYLIRRALGIGEASQAFREYVEEFQSATRGYAKQQIAWFRKEPKFHWVRAQGAVEVVRELVEMEMEEYERFREGEQERQKGVREEMVRQGKLMKGYVGQKTRLVEGSDAERAAVALAERWAERLREKLAKEELERMLQVVTR